MITATVTNKLNNGKKRSMVSDMGTKRFPSCFDSRVEKQPK